MHSGKDGWMDDMQFYVLFNSISVIPGQWDVDNERLCAGEHRLQLRSVVLFAWGSFVLTRRSALSVAFIKKCL